MFAVAVPLAVSGLVGRQRTVAASTGLALHDIPTDLLALFLEATERRRVAWNLLAAVACRESGWSPEVIACRRHSPAGAQGLMQLMPATAAGLGVDPCDPVQAIEGAGRLLAGHRSRFGSWELALAAYNAGAGAVLRYGGIPPHPETQAYVPAVLRRAADYPCLSRPP